MADIFISYAKEDETFVSNLVDGLTAFGCSVWWDRNIAHGKYFDRVIESELQSARAVIVVWSESSRDSDWCRAEAAEALELNKLVPIAIQRAKPPLRFTHLQTGDFSTWNGDLDARAFVALCRDLAAYGLTPNVAQQDHPAEAGASAVGAADSQRALGADKVASSSRRRLLTIGIPAVVGTVAGSSALFVGLPRILKPSANDPVHASADDQVDDPHLTGAPALTSETSIRGAVAWFKEHFSAQIARRIAGTPLTPSFIAALAVSESYYLWGQPLPPMAIGDLLELCVGDVLDAPMRHVFPGTKADLLSEPNGQKMFEIARTALVNTSKYNRAYAAIAAGNPDKFAHAFGVFSYDLQFSKNYPDFFLQRQWRDFDKSLDLAMPLLLQAIARSPGNGKAALTDDELIYVGIAWNKGRVDLQKGLKQGFRDASGRYYGESLMTYLKIAKEIPDVS